LQTLQVRPAVGSSVRSGHAITAAPLTSGFGRDTVPSDVLVGNDLTGSVAVVTGG